MNETLLEELVDYCKIEAEEEIELVLLPLYLAAKGLILESTGKEFSEEPLDGYAEQRRQLYWLAIKMLVLHWYDNRGIIDSASVNDIPLSAKEIIKIIKHSIEYGESV